MKEKIIQLLQSTNQDDVILGIRMMDKSLSSLLFDKLGGNIYQSNFKVSIKLESCIIYTDDASYWMNSEWIYKYDYLVGKDDGDKIIDYREKDTRPIRGYPQRLYYERKNNRTIK